VFAFTLPFTVVSFRSARHLCPALRSERVGMAGYYGMIWISWPKKVSKVPTDITEDVIRDIVLPTGLVDVKVCAVDDTWSGLKLVVRKGYRK
jgi:hypothetical protein